MKLDDLVAALETEAEELDGEGVNILEYWFARCDINDDEFYEWIDLTVAEIVVQPGFMDLPEREKLRVICTHSFLYGLLYGLNRREDEL